MHVSTTLALLLATAVAFVSARSDFADTYPENIVLGKTVRPTLSEFDNIACAANPAYPNSFSMSVGPLYAYDNDTMVRPFNVSLTKGHVKAYSLGPWEASTTEAIVSEIICPSPGIITVRVKMSRKIAGFVGLTLVADDAMWKKNDRDPMFGGELQAAGEVLLSWERTMQPIKHTDKVDYICVGPWQDPMKIYRRGVDWMPESKALILKMGPGQQWPEQWAFSIAQRALSGVKDKVLGMIADPLSQILLNSRACTQVERALENITTNPSLEK